MKCLDSYQLLNNFSESHDQKKMAQAKNKLLQKIFPPRHAENVSLSSLKTLNQLEDFHHCAVIVFDTALRPKYFNPTFKRLCKRIRKTKSAKSLKNKSNSSTLTEWPEIEKLCTPYLLKVQLQAQEILNVQIASFDQEKSYKQLVTCHFFPIFQTDLQVSRPENLQGVCMMITDVQNRSIENMVEKIEIIDKKFNQEREKFISMLSHELKTPLTSLKLNFHCIVKRIKQFNQIKEHQTDHSNHSDQTYLTDQIAKINQLEWEKINKNLKSCDEQINRLTGLINDMLEIFPSPMDLLYSPSADWESWPSEKKDLNDIILQSVQHHFPDDLQQGRLQLNYDKSLSLEGLWQEKSLQKILFHLISNAKKYGFNQNKSIMLTWSVQKNKQASDCIEIVVKDFGQGINLHDHPRVFDLFARFHHDENISGLGLGLPLTKILVEKMGGEISLERAKTAEEGAIFKIKIPFLEDEKR